MCEISLQDTRSSLPSSFSFSQHDNLVGSQFHGVHYFNSLIDKGVHKYLHQQGAGGGTQLVECLCGMQEAAGSIHSLADSTRRVWWRVPVTLEVERQAGQRFEVFFREFEASVGCRRPYPKISKQVNETEHLCSCQDGYFRRRQYKMSWAQ